MNEILNIISLIIILVSILGPLFFWYIRKYISKRIETGFSLQVEAFKHSNSIEVEHLKADFNTRIELLRASLSVSQSAATLLLQKRIAAYEGIFSRLHELTDKLCSLKVRNSPATHKSTIAELVNQFCYATSEMRRHAETVVPFISSEVVLLLNEITSEMHNQANNIYAGQSKSDIDEWQSFLSKKNQLENIIREDLCSIITDGKLTYPEINLVRQGTDPL